MARQPRVTRRPHLYATFSQSTLGSRILVITMETPEFFSEEEELAHTEKILTKIANQEYNGVLKAIKSGHTPDIIDRILLRMARKERARKCKKKQAKR